MVTSNIAPVQKIAESKLEEVEKDLNEEIANSNAAKVTEYLEAV